MFFTVSVIYDKQHKDLCRTNINLKYIHTKRNKVCEHLC